jgi:hypothetical protein
MSATPPVPSPEEGTGSLSPANILTIARKAVPAVDYALGAAGVAAAAAIVTGFLGNGRAAIIILGGMLIAMLLLFAFARLVASQSAAVNNAGIVLLWSAIAFFCIFLLFTVTAFAFWWPAPWAQALGVPQLSSRGPIEDATTVGIPKYEDKAVNIWIVGSPHTDDVPPSRIPVEILDNARVSFISIDVKVLPAKGFADTFFRSFEKNLGPDVLIVDNIGHIDGITTPRGNFVGIASNPKVRSALVTVSQSFDSFGSGWKFLISTSRNHDKAKALAMVPPKCKAEFSESVGKLSPVELSQARAVAISAGYSYLTCNREGMSAISDKDRLGTGCIDEKEPYFTKVVNACGVFGNERLAFVSLVTSFSNERSVGQMSLISALRKPEQKWQLLSISGDPVSVDLLEGPFQRLASSLMQSPVADLRAPAPAELITADWQLPEPASGERFGNFIWKPSPSPDVIGEIVEFEYGSSTRLFLFFDLSASEKQLSTGNLWITDDIWHWRIWSIGKSGALALSPHRSFKNKIR